VASGSSTAVAADVLSKTAEKQPAARRFGATITQVGDDGRADVWRDRHPRSLTTLGANEHLARSPVDIVQGERRDLVGPQAEQTSFRHRRIAGRWLTMDLGARPRSLRK
jgi:hypothetical protein